MTIKIIEDKIKKILENKVKEALEKKQIDDYEIEVNPKKCKIYVTIDGLTSVITYHFNDFVILTNFLNIVDNFICREIKKIVKLKKYVICLRNGCEIKDLIVCDGIKVEYNYDCLINGLSIICCSKDLKNFEEKNKHLICTCHRDITASVCASNTSQTIGPFINRLGINKSSRRAGTGKPTSTLSTNIYCFVVDTGIQPNHTDLPVPLTISRNFTTNNPSRWNDDNGHGTHVAGIIAAVDNTRGIVGNAPNVKIVAIKVLNRNGSGYMSNIIAGLNYINNWKNNNPSAQVIVNMSLGGGFYQPLNNAVQNLISNGINVCVAAGNSSANAINYSPASTPNAITVGSYNASNNTLSSFSNYGSLVDILAPGEAIDSTYPTNTYRVLSGTSMATPMVVGIIADLINSNNTLTPSQIRDKLIADSSNLTPTNNDTSIGSNPRITLSNVATQAGTTNISVYGGMY